MPVDLPLMVIELFEKPVAAHALRAVVNEKIERLTADLKHLCPPGPGITAEEGDGDRKERLPQAARGLSYPAP
jgi:hypothetical protein